MSEATNVMAGAFSSTSRRLTFAFVALVVVMAAALYDPSPGSSKLPAPSCASVLVLGLRGSGDSMSAGHGMGEDSWAVAQRLLHGLAGGPTTRAVGFPYDTGTFWRMPDRVPAAASSLVSYLSRRAQRCPDERWALIGQSEGAAVIHYALPQLGFRLAAAVLIADPLRVARTPYDTSASTHSGVLAAVMFEGAHSLTSGAISDNVPATMDTLVRSYCLDTDPVCAFTPRNVGSGAHTTYRDNAGGLADQAAAWAATQLH